MALIRIVMAKFLKTYSDSSDKDMILNDFLEDMFAEKNISKELRNFYDLIKKVLKGELNLDDRESNDQQKIRVDCRAISLH